MTTRAALFALLAMWGVSTAGTLPAAAQEVEPAKEAETGDGLEDRVWVRTGSDLPGSMVIFLSDGTLVQDSCWETHRLSAWKREGDTSLSWDEDGMEIRADVVSLSADELVLSLKLSGGDVEERFTPAEVPYLCPDMPT
jgi:hypothetical protein